MTAVTADEQTGVYRETAGGNPERSPRRRFPPAEYYLYF